jgi:hypothetical protein
VMERTVGIATGMPPTMSTSVFSKVGHCSRPVQQKFRPKRFVYTPTG